MEIILNPGILILALCFGVVTVITWAPIAIKRNNKEHKESL